MSYGTKIPSIFIHSLQLEVYKCQGLTVVCENLLGGRVGGIISKPSLWRLLLTDSSTRCSKLAKNPGGKQTLRYLWRGLGLPYLRKT